MSQERLTRDFILLRALRWLPLGLVLPFLTITPVDRGLSLAQGGAAFAVHGAVALLLEVPSGVLADTLGRRRVLLAGAALTAVSLAVFAFADALVAFIGSLAALAAGRALISGALEAWYVDSLRALDPSAPLAAGLSRGTAAEGVALALGSLAGGGIVTVSNYTYTGLAASAAALVYLVAVAWLVRETHPPAHEHRAGARMRARVRSVVGTARAEARASVTVRMVLVAAVAFGMSLASVELLWQPRLGELLATDGSHGVAFGALAAGSMLVVAIGAAAVGPRMRRRVSVSTVYLGSLLVTAVCIAALGLPSGAALFAVVYLLVYLGAGAAEPLHSELLNEAVGSEARATMISADALSAQCGALVANLGGGLLASAASPGTAWVVAGGVVVLTVAYVAPRLRGSRRLEART
ncbi:MAG TPA: MFS transporter [Thermoleophilaceae bacterium]|nr:MFS transporter [Thermoleophilaceae bacterium]